MNLQLAISQCSQLIKLGHFTEAIQICDFIISAQPESHIGYSLKIECLRKLNLYEEAIALTDVAIGHGHATFRLYFYKAKMLSNLGQYEEALQAYDQACNIDPNNGDAWYNRGHVLCELNELEASIDSYDKAIEIDPHDKQAFFNQANSLHHLKRYEEAIISNKKAVEIDPRYSKAWLNLGISFKELGIIEEATFAYQKAIEIDPQLSLGWYNLGQIHHVQGRFAEAANYLRRAYMGELPPIAIYHLASSYSKSLDNPLFVHRLSKENPALQVVFSELTEYFKKVALEIEDFIDFTRVLEHNLDPEVDTASIKVIGKIYYYLGDPEKAVSHFSILNRRDEEDLEVCYYLILSLQALEFDEEWNELLANSLSNWKTLIKDRPDLKNQPYYAALIFDLIGKGKEALECATLLMDDYLPAKYVAYADLESSDHELKESLLNDIQQAEEKSLQLNRPSYLIPSPPGAIQVTEMSEFLDPISFHSEAQEIWHAVKKVKEAIQKGSDQNTNIYREVQKERDPYQPLRFMFNIRQTEQLKKEINARAEEISRIEMSTLADSAYQAIDMSFAIVKNFSLMREIREGKEIDPVDAEVRLGEFLSLLQGNYVQQLPNIQYMLSFLFLKRIINARVLMLMNSYAVAMCSLELKKTKQSKALLNLRGIFFGIKILDSVTGLTGIISLIEAVNQLSGTPDASYDTITNFGPDILETYLSQDLNHLSFPDFLENYQQFLSHERELLGEEEFNEKYSWKHLFL